MCVEYPVVYYCSRRTDGGACGNRYNVDHGRGLEAKVVQCKQRLVRKCRGLDKSRGILATFERRWCDACIDGEAEAKLAAGVDGALVEKKYMEKRREREAGILSWLKDNHRP